MMWLNETHIQPTWLNHYLCELHNTLNQKNLCIVITDIKGVCSLTQGCALEVSGSILSGAKNIRLFLPICTSLVDRVPQYLCWWELVGTLWN